MSSVESANEHEVRHELERLVRRGVALIHDPSLLAELERRAPAHGFEVQIVSEDIGEIVTAVWPGIDPTSGLPNAAALTQELARRPGHTQLTTMAIDVVRMRAIVELGARAGDELIRCLGQRLTETLLADEYAARAAAKHDEFVVLLHGPSASVAEKRALEIRARIETMALPPAIRARYRGVHMTLARGSPATRPDRAALAALAESKLSAQPKALAQRPPKHAPAGAVARAIALLRPRRGSEGQP